MKKVSWMLSLLIAFTMDSQAQSYQKTALGISTNIGANKVEIQFYTPSIVRVLKSPGDKPFTKQSLTVVATPQTVALSIHQQNDRVTLKSAAIQVNLNLASGQIIYTTNKGEQLLQEQANGISFTPFDDAGSNTFKISQSFTLDKDESIYGLGQQQRGKLSLRNEKINMVQGNTDDYVPFLVSTKGYGLFWDNYSPTVFEDKPDGTSFISDVGDCIDYYFIAGGSIEKSIAGMRELTGQVPMFPLWTYGFWQSKERYKSQSELVGVVKKYRELGVPLDGIIQDWQYWGNNYLWNAMEFLNPEFPDPKRMVDDIHNMNAHLIISIWNSFGPQTKQFREMQPKGMLLNFGTWPQSGLERWPPNRDYPSDVQPYDPYNPEARDIYWKYLQKMFALGIDGWWMDSSEPDHLDVKPADFNLKTYLGSFRKVRNAFPLMTVGGVSQHQRVTSTDKRIFILTRSAFAGQQRYGANTWSGDVNSSWQSLRNQIPAGLNFSMSAIPYWNADIGGFFAGSYNTGWNGEGAENPSFRELYVRWLQFGAFTPMMRSHGTDIPREIYNFGKKGEPIYDAIAKSINLRYALLPYIYATAWAVTSEQSSIMRALVMDFKDKKVVDMNNEYLFGTSILVAPIVNAQYTPEIVVGANAETGWDKKDGDGSNKSQAIDFTETKSTKVYLPEGTVWFDYWTNEQLNGGQEIVKATTIDEIPLFIKAGSIIPFGPQVQYAAEKKWDSLAICIYPGADGKFVLYEDENDNYNYEKGAYATIAFSWDDAKKTLTIGGQKGKYPGMLTDRMFKVTVITGKKQTPYKAVSYHGKPVVVKF